jgi:hypothetical protein
MLYDSLGNYWGHKNKGSIVNMQLAKKKISKQF